MAADSDDIFRLVRALGDKLDTGFGKALCRQQIQSPTSLLLDGVKRVTNSFDCANGGAGFVEVDGVKCVTVVFEGVKCVTVSGRTRVGRC